MGYNTVAVLLNDHANEIAECGPLGKRIADAIGGWNYRDRVSLATYFGCGSVISQDHADNAQVVIVQYNTGVRAFEAKNLDWHALHQMATCLENHGYTVRKKRKPKAAGDTHD